jgi:hypothetical protein
MAPLTVGADAELALVDDASDTAEDAAEVEAEALPELAALEAAWEPDPPHAEMTSAMVSAAVRAIALPNVFMLHLPFRAPLGPSLPNAVHTAA